MINGKRTRKQNKILKEMIKGLDHRLGEQNTGFLISMLIDCLDKLTKDGDKNMRTLEIRINEFFSVKYNFEKDVFEK